jgi:hypothetical protein
MRSNSRAVVLALLAGMTGCSSAYESDVLALRYEPPRGVQLQEEVAGPPSVARFSSGLELWSAPVTVPTPSEATLRPLFDAAVRATGVTLKGTVQSSRAGNLPAGPVARYELKSPGERSLLYILPLQTRVLVVHLNAPEASYGPLEARVERSLASLRPR